MEPELGLELTLLYNIENCRYRSYFIAVSITNFYEQYVFIRMAIFYDNYVPNILLFGYKVLKPFS